MFNNVYHKKRVLITGHTGFKGSWLALWLSRLGADIAGYSLAPPTTPSHYELLNLPLTSFIGDIRDNATFLKLVSQFRPEIIFHLAAQPLVRLSYQKPRSTIETNIMGTVNVLEACRSIDSVRAVVNVTSDKCYKNKEWIWGYRETDPLGGHDPYSASKGCSELITTAYRNSFFNPKTYGDTHHVLLASARAGNVIGGGDWGEDRLVPDMMRAAALKQKSLIRNPHSRRPWQHVLEPLSGYLCLGQRLLEEKINYAQGWNFGPSDEHSITVSEVADHIKNFWKNVNFTVSKNASGQVHEAGLLKLDSSKASLHLRWKCVWDIQTAFEKTVEWYRRFYQSKRVSSLQNLEKYLEDASNRKIEWAIC